MNASCSLTVLERLKIAGLRPTRQRLALAGILFIGEDRHVTAEQLHGEAQHRAIPVSLATVYNTLHQFTEAGLLREVVVEPGRSYFDTNTTEHHHFYEEAGGQLCDIPGSSLNVVCLPSPPAGMTITSVEVIIPGRTDTGLKTDARSLRPKRAIRCVQTAEAMVSRRSWIQSNN